MAAISFWIPAGDAQQGGLLGDVAADVAGGAGAGGHGGGAAAVGAPPHPAGLACCHSSSCLPKGPTPLGR